MIKSSVMATISRNLSDRGSERELLGRLIDADKSEFLALYGRRRVGKTFLIRRFFQDQPVDYFELVGRFQGTLEHHLRIFAEALAETFYAGAAIAAPKTWHDAFQMLREAMEKRRGRRRKTVLFLDELPWIATHRSGCLRELEHFWNAWCSRRDDIVLVVCGSAASWMLRRIVHARGGLHGRLTQTIRLSPFTLREAAEYFRDRKLRFTDRELIELYMVFGGVPHYLDHVVRGRSVAQLVDQIVLARNGALANEFDRLYASLFDSDKRYVDVMRALARRRRGLLRNELLAAVGQPSGGGATTILATLEEGGFITSTIPYGRTKRERIYRLTDELSLFHLKWLDGRRPENWQHVHRTPRWHAWAGLAFESLCLKHSEAIKHALGISGVQTDVSAWLHADAQLDLLIDRADGVISICELKFVDAPFSITKKYAADLRRKLNVFRERTGTRKRLDLVFVSSYGVASNAHADELVDCSIEMDALLR